MPKSPHSSSPPSHTTPNLLTTTDTISNIFDYSSQNNSSESAIKKKKNADAQAAFRARRANYIATLEETVTSLESVIIQLQDSFRETRNEAAMLAQENYRLRRVIDTLKEENRKRENYFDVLLNTRNGSDCHPFVDNIQQSLSINSAFSQLDGRSDARSSHSCINLIEPYASGDSERNKPNSMHEEHASSSESRIYQALDQPSLTHLMKNEFDAGQQARYAHQHGSQSRGLQANEPMLKDHDIMTGRFKELSQQGSLQNDCRPPEALTNSPYSPSYSGSPAGSSMELLYDSQGQIINDLTNHDAHIRVDFTSYLPSDSVASSPSNSSSSSSLNFVLPPDILGRLKNDTFYQSRPKEELMIHGGTADVSSLAKGMRYCSAGVERPLLGNIFHINGVECSSQSRGSRGHNYTYLPYPPSLRSLQTAPESPASRSPSLTSPIHPHISSTLAVIKAQAFGALRKTRSRHTRLSNEEIKAKFELQGEVERSSR